MVSPNIRPRIACRDDGQLATNAAAGSVPELFQEREPHRIYEQIALQIEHAIFQRKLRLGDKLPPERELVEHYGASRVVVREALRMLQIKGLLEVRKGATGGYFVRHADSDVLRDGLRTLAILGEFSVANLAEVRLAIEPEVARLAAVRATRQDTDAMAALLECRARVAAEGGEVAPHDLEFHRLVADASKNPLYVALLDSLMKLEADLVVSTIAFDSDDHARVDEAHREILAAIKRRDPEGALDAMRSHAQDLQDVKLNEAAEAPKDRAPARRKRAQVKQHQD